MNPCFNDPNASPEFTEYAAGELALGLAVLRYVGMQLERIEQQLSQDHAVHLPEYATRHQSPHPAQKRVPLQHETLNGTLFVN
jgi:hypothetical protein